MRAHRMRLQTLAGQGSKEVKVSTRWRLLFLGIIFSLFYSSLYAEPGLSPKKSIINFLDNHCLDCHDDTSSKGELDLLELSLAPDNPENRDRWILIYDRVKKGEMPPPEKAERLSDGERKDLLVPLYKTLVEADRADVIANGRGLLRRLTRDEYENNLRDLLKLPYLDIKNRLPEDRNSNGYTKSSETLDMSRVQMAAYLDAAKAALLEALCSGVEPEKPIEFRAVGTDLFPSLETFGNREAMFFSKNGKMLPINGKDFNAMTDAEKHDPELEMALFRSATWPYYGYPRGFRAKHDGAYRVRFSARAVRQARDFRLVPAHDPQPMTFRSRQPSGPDVSGDLRSTGGWIDLGPENQIHETTIRLEAGETFEYSLLGLPVPYVRSDRGPLYYNYPPMPEGGHRGAAFQWLEVTGPIKPAEWPPPSHRFLFGDLPIRAASEGSGLPVEVISENAKVDAERLFRRFAESAARRPVPEEARQVFLSLISDKLDEGAPFAEAMLKAYQAFLCSSHFLYLLEPQGKGEAAQVAIASRLSHFLWSSRPDDELQKKASGGKLREKETIRAEVERLIDDERFERFVADFTGEWLDLHELRRDIPDNRLYPEYRKDDYLVDSMERETHAVFTAMVRENLPVTMLVDADFTYVNDRLARHNDLPRVKGSAMRRVELPDWSPYGGLLAQASILKITANGTTTSPVLRGSWVMEKLIGDPPPPPPKSVSAIEPDIRGASTVRELLAKHTESESCLNCHARFDPVGFALENFDVMGAWRDRYRGMEQGDLVTGIDRAGHPFEYRVALAVDSSGKLLSGEAFEDVRDLKTALATRPRQLASNLLHQFTLYATGTAVRFSDRAEIEVILDQCEAGGYRVRDLLRGLVQSQIFLGTLPPK